jgi:nicotinamide-nucleotide amidase
MTADILTIGDEILIGQILDTNSQYIATELTKTGIAIRQMLSVSDNKSAIVSALDQSIGKVACVIITGGLGPTSDDITKSTLLNYFGGSYILHQESLQVITEFFAKRGKEVTELNRKQAEIPSICNVLLNKNGTAPGMLFEKNNTLIFSLPGVPFEMKELLLNEVIPIIKNRYILPTILHRTLLIEGISESLLADKLNTWENNLNSVIKVAYLPSPGLLRLRLSVSGNNKDELNKKLNTESAYLTNLIGEDSVYGFDNDTLENIVGSLLIEKQLSISIAESCTGGNISHLITSVPGSSTYFMGSVIAYSNNVKTNTLSVPAEIIEKYGAVSQEVVELMAKGVKGLFNTDCAIATTGIAGPDGGSPQKPVGTVWIAVIYKENIKSVKYLFGDNRERNIIRSSLSALNMMRNLLKSK